MFFPGPVPTCVCVKFCEDCFCIPDRQTNKQRRKQRDKQTNTTYQMKISFHEISAGNKQKNTVPSAHMKSVNGHRPTHCDRELKF